MFNSLYSTIHLDLRHKQKWDGYFNVINGDNE